MKIATLLAVMAICLQAVVFAHGGRICYRMPPFPQSEGCEAECCGAHEAAPAPAVAELVFELLADWTDSDCCLVQAPSYFISPAADVNANALGTAALFAVPNVAPHVLPQVSAAASHSPQDAHPPPSSVVIRTTVLLI